MGWNGAQQFVVLIKSIAVGCVIGMVFDVSSGFWRGKAYRLPLFISDVFLCVLAALLTFFGALSIADGQLHPVLFLGVFCGVLVEHYTIGRVLTYLAYRIRKGVVRCAACFSRAAQYGEHFITALFKIITKRRDAEEND